MMCPGRHNDIVGVVTDERPPITLSVKEEAKTDLERVVGVVVRLRVEHQTQSRH